MYACDARSDCVVSKRKRRNETKGDIDAQRPLKTVGSHPKIDDDAFPSHTATEKSLGEREREKMDVSL